MRWLALALLIAAPCLAGAQDIAASKWPGLYEVVNVAVNDRLNVRSAPDPTSEILGSLAHDAKGIEVIGRAPRPSGSGLWGRVNFGERAGWVNMRFLRLRSEVSRPTSYICFGTEPFWAFTDRVSDGFKFQFPDANPLFFRPRANGQSQNRTDRYFVTGANDETTFGGVIRAELCSDGMSDREYGMAIDLGLFGEAGATFLSGCCSVAP